MSTQRPHLVNLDELPRLKSAFDRDGYLLVRQALRPAALEELRQQLLAAYAAAQSSGELFSGGGGISGHLNCFPGEISRFIHTELLERGLMDLLAKLMPTTMERGQPNVGCNFNLPGSLAQHYHVDSAFLKEFAITNIAIVDTDVVNGAIDVLPGTHDRFYPYWQFAMKQLAKGSTRLPMKQGDVLIRTSNLWHRGMPNRSQVTRPMVALTWEDGGQPMAADPFQKSEGRVSFHPNWYAPTPLGRLRERLFVGAPITYDAVRLARSIGSQRGYENW